MKALLQINGTANCPVWEALAAPYRMTTKWLEFNQLNDPEDFEPDLIIVQYLTNFHDLRERGWDRLHCSIFGSCGDALPITNTDVAFLNANTTLTRLYVEGLDYISAYRDWAISSDRDPSIEKLRYQKLCADTLFPPIDLPKIYDWVFIGQVYPAYDQRLKHYRNGLIPLLYHQNPNGFIAGSGGWEKLLCLDREVRWIPQAEVNKYYAQSRVVVSIDAHDGSGYTSTRPIEAMHGAHCTFIYDHPGLDYFKKFIRHGHHAFYFKTISDFNTHLDFVKSHPEQAKEIGLAAREVVLRNKWTYSGWLESILTEFVGNFR